MTAWLYLGLVLAAGAGMVATYFKGAEDAENRIMATRATLLLQVAEDKEEMLNAVVEAVKGIEIEQKTIVRNFKTIEKENVVYRECKHSDDAVRLLNSALRGDPVPSQPAVQDTVPDQPR